MSLRPALRGSGLAVAGALASLAAAAPASAVVRDFPVPTPDAGLDHIVAGKDGSLWFSEKKGFKVGRITTAGQITEWTVPKDGEFGPEQLTVAADGRIWVLSDAHGMVFVIDPAVPGGPVAGYDLTNGQLGGRRGNDIAAAPDGTVWITDNLGDGVVRIRADGAGADSRGGPPECDFDGILAPGPDGRMWCASNTSAGDALKRIELDGVTSTSLPMGSGFAVGALAAGPGGTMWFGRNSAGSYAFKPGRGSVGRMTADGGVQEWPVGDKVAPTSIAAGPDGAMWFGSIGSDAVVGRVTPAGQVTTLPLGVRRANDVAFGGDGALWFLDQNANRVTRMTRDEVGGGTTGPAPAGTPAIPAAPPADGPGLRAGSYCTSRRLPVRTS